MHLELRRRVAQGGEGGHGGDLAFAQGEAGARVDVSERELDQEPFEARNRPRQSGGHGQSSRAGHLLQHRQAASVALIHDYRVLKEGAELAVGIGLARSGRRHPAMEALEQASRQVFGPAT